MFWDANQKAMTTATAVVKDESRAIHISGGKLGILVLQTRRSTVAHSSPTSVKVINGRVIALTISTKSFKVSRAPWAAVLRRASWRTLPAPPPAILAHPQVRGVAR